LFDLTGILAVELRTVLAVAEVESFSLAARQINVQSSTVSRRIRDLEDRIGVSLFERYAHGVRLTAAGHAFLEQIDQARPILTAAVEQARRDGVAATGHLRLGFVWSFSVGVAREIAAAYRAQNPNIRLELSELGAAELTKRTLARQIDYAWIVCWRDLDPALRVERLWSEALHLAAPRRQTHSGSQDWSVLAREPYLCRSTDEWRHFQRHLDQVGGPQMDIRAHDCSRETLLSLVAAGDGVTLLPESIAALGHPGVQFLPMKDPRGRLEICAIWRRETDNPALRRFLVTTREWLRKNPPDPPAPSALG
jgi:DNA-binding transcriptional LysR family regulator